MAHVVERETDAHLAREARAEAAAESAEKVRAELQAQPEFIVEAMQWVGDEFAQAVIAGDAAAVLAAVRAALNQHADEQRDSYQRKSRFQCSDEAAYSYLLRMFRPAVLS